MENKEIITIVQSIILIISFLLIVFTLQKYTLFNNNNNKIIITLLFMIILINVLNILFVQLMVIKSYNYLFIIILGLNLIFLFMIKSKYNLYFNTIFYFMFFEGLIMFLFNFYLLIENSINDNIKAIINNINFIK
jgi:hypothetical protein